MHGLAFVDGDGNVETLGMTNERQQEIQGSLFRMLGHDVDENSNAESDSKTSQDGVVNGNLDNNTDAYDASSGEDDDILVSSTNKETSANRIACYLLLFFTLQMQNALLLSIRTAITISVAVTTQLLLVIDQWYWSL